MTTPEQIAQSITNLLAQKERDDLEQLGRAEIERRRLEAAQRAVGVKAVIIILALACSSSAAAQPRPVTQWSDWTSYGTSIGNPASAAVNAWRSDRPACALGRLAISEGIGNGIALLAKRTYASPRPCLGCAPDGMPSGHTMNSVIGSSRAWRGGWQRWLISTGLVAATAALRVDAGRHTWRQVTAGALLGIGAESVGQLIRCE